MSRRPGNTCSVYRLGRRPGALFPSQYRQGMGNGRIWRCPDPLTAADREAARGKQEAAH